jgi:predicted phage terminase large subunit-like protein
MQVKGNLIISCSHSADLAVSFGRKCRNLVDRHSIELGYGLSKDSRAADKWSTTNGNEYYCAGVGAGIAGRRGDLGLIDDPIGSKEVAESKLERDKLWNWYEFDFVPRLKPGSPIILIQTRWHEDDLCGRLLARESGEWEVIHIPFIAMKDDILGREEGAVLWPEWYQKNDSAKKDVEKAKLSGSFSSLYQGQPSPEEGDYFKKEWFSPSLYYNTDQLPKDLRIYVASDHALTKKQENDSHCLLPVGIDSQGDVWVLPDVWWKQGDTLDLVNNMIEMAKRRKPINWWAEDEHIYKGIGPFLNQQMREKGVYFCIEGITSTKDLMQRASSIRGMCKLYRVHLPAFASWYHDAMHQLLMFPNGAHDDFVAAFAKLGQGLDRITNPVKPSPEESTVPVIKPFKPTIKWLKELARESQMSGMPRYDGR